MYNKQNVSFLCDVRKSETVTDCVHAHTCGINGSVSLTKMMCIQPYKYTVVYYMSEYLKKYKFINYLILNYFEMIVFF